MKRLTKFVDHVKHSMESDGDCLETAIERALDWYDSEYDTDLFNEFLEEDEGNDTKIEFTADM